MSNESDSSDWGQTIGTLILVQQHIRDLDSEGIYRYHLPAVASSVEAIGEVERALRHDLAPAYKAFLLHANGWRGFLQWIDLFGTRELLDQQYAGRARTEIEAIEHDGGLPGSDVRAADLLPIGMTAKGASNSDKGNDLFCLVKPGHDLAGWVIWFAREEVDRFSDFREFFLAMIDYNREVFSRLVEEKKSRGLS